MKVLFDYRTVRKTRNQTTITFNIILENIPEVIIVDQLFCTIYFCTSSVKNKF